MIRRMRVIEDREFRDFYDRNSGKTFSDLEFRRCQFRNGVLSVATRSRKRSTVRNVRLVDCTAWNCSIWSPVLDDITVDGLDTVGTTLWARGAVCKHVTLRGNIGDIVLGPLYASKGVGISPARARDFSAANTAYYATVDWALDIREAAFEEADLRDVPGQLVRRDPATQVLVTRARALEGHWRDLDLSRTYWPTTLECFLRDSTLDAIVLVAPKRIRPSSLCTYQTLLDGLRLLRDEGIAEPE